MQSQKSIRYLIFSDFKRKYDALGYEIPKNIFKLYLIIIKLIISSKGFRSIFLYRILHRFRDDHPLNSFLALIRWISFSLDIPPKTVIGEGFLIGHPEGIVINGKCIIGKNFSIYQGVTLGGNLAKIKNGQEAPWIGDNVFIGAGAKILGPVKIGENCIIGANSVVLNDIPKNSVAVGIPSRVIKKVEKNYLQIEQEYKNRLLMRNK